MPLPGNGELVGPDDLITAAMADRIAALLLAGSVVVIVIAVLMLIGLALVMIGRG
jgi:hypothetical protein